MRFFALAAALLTLGLASAAGQDADRAVTAIWTETLRYGTDPEVLDALESIRSAKETGLNGDLAALVAASSNDDVRSRILVYLGDQGDGRAADAAVDLLARADQLSPGLLRSAIAYVARTKTQRAYQDLTTLVTSRDETVAAAAVGAIGTLGGEGATKLLMDAYGKPDTPANIKNQIVLALGDLAAPESVELLMDIAGDRGAERVVRMYACASLGKIGDLRAVSVLTSVLSESDALLRTYAAAGLGKLRAPGVAAALTQVLRDSSPQVRLEAARAIADGAAGGGDAAEELVGMLTYRARRDEVAQVRREAIRALGTVGSQACFDVLREILVDARQSVEVRAAALTELLRGDLAKSLDGVWKVIDQEWVSRPDRQKMLEAAADLLAKTESASLEPIYARLVTSPNVPVRISAIRGIARNRLLALADRVQAAARDEQPVVRREALAALEKLGLPAPAASNPSAAPSGTR